MKGGVENETSSPFLPSSQTLVKPVAFFPDLFSSNFDCAYLINGVLRKVDDCHLCAYHCSKDCIDCKLIFCIYHETKKK